MATLGDLVVKLSMDAAGFTSDAGRAAFVAEKSMARIVAAGNLAAAGIVALGVAFVSAATAAAKALPGIADAVAEQVDALDEAAEAAGISAVAYQKLQLAMQEAGVETEQFDSGMKKLSQSIVDAAEDTDGKAAVAFQRLGISVRNADGSIKSVDQTIAELSARFQTLPAGPEKVAIAVELMGKAGAKWIPALNSDLTALGNKAEEVGAVFSQELTQGTEDYKAALASLSIAQQGLKNVIAENMLVPMTEAAKVLEEFIKALIAAASATDKITASGAQEFFRNLARAAAFTVDVFATLSDLVLTLGEGLGALGFAANQYSEALQNLATLDFAASKQSIKNIGDALDEWREAAKKRLEREPLRVRLELQFAEADAAQAQRLKDAAKRLTPELRGQIETPLGTAPPKASKIKDKEGFLRDLQKLAKMQEQDAKEAAQARIDADTHASEEAIRIAEQEQERLAKLAEKTRDFQAKIDEEMFQEQQDFSKRIAQEWQKLQDEREAAFQRIEDVFSGAIADSLTDLATGAKSVGDAFRDMAQQIGQAMTRIAAQKVAEGFMDWLLKGSGGEAKTEGFGGLIAGVFKNLGGAQHGKLFTAGGMIRVGERGPEMIHTMTGGRVEPIQQSQPTTNNVSVNVNVPPSTDRRTADQIAAQVGLAVGRAMRRIQ